MSRCVDEWMSRHLYTFTRLRIYAFDNGQGKPAI
jgi:hypothetical protein